MYHILRLLSCSDGKALESLTLLMRSFYKPKININLPSKQIEFNSFRFCLNIIQFFAHLIPFFSFHFFFLFVSFIVIHVSHATVAWWWCCCCCWLCWCCIFKRTMFVLRSPFDYVLCTINSINTFVHSIHWLYSPIPVDTMLNDPTIESTSVWWCTTTRT